MKKIFLFAAFAVLSLGTIMAQNTFRGTVIYKVTSTGETTFQIPDEVATAEVKVYDDKVLTSSKIFTNQMVNSVLIDGHKQYNCMDLSMIFMYLQSNDVELDYKGSSKILATHEFSQQDIDSLTIPVTEGFYIEYVDGESKSIAGEAAKKAVVHAFDEDGEDHPTVIWYSDAMGPDVNFLFNGIRGVALEYSMDLGEGRQITLSASEIKKGKVKEVDMLLPSGYEVLSDEEFKSLFEQINEELRYLQDE
ncbi:MAG: hypothetical protein J6X58_04835 [Bacteroidales bacterium]|nr:hypothetical protein [Bacteroidales bacterium]